MKEIKTNLKNLASYTERNQKSLLEYINSIAVPPDLNKPQEKNNYMKGSGPSEKTKGKIGVKKTPLNQKGTLHSGSIDKADI